MAPRSRLLITSREQLVSLNMYSKPPLHCPKEYQGVSILSNKLGHIWHCRTIVKSILFLIAWLILKPCKLLSVIGLLCITSRDNCISDSLADTQNSQTSFSNLAIMYNVGNVERCIMSCPLITSPKWKYRDGHGRTAQHESLLECAISSDHCWCFIEEQSMKKKCIAS